MDKRKTQTWRRSEFKESRKDLFKIIVESDPKGLLVNYEGTRQLHHTPILRKMIKTGQAYLNRVTYGTCLRVNVPKQLSYICLTPKGRKTAKGIM